MSANVRKWLAFAVPTVALVAVLLTAWQAAATDGSSTLFFFSSPAAVSSALVRLVINGYRRYPQAEPNLRSKKEPLENSRDFPVKLLLIGTQRLSRYMDIVAQNAYDPLRLGRAGGKTILTIGPARFSRTCTPYFEIVAQDINQTRTRIPIVSVPSAHLEKSSNRRSFFHNIFDGAFPAQRGIHKPILAFEILRTLAYIGQPS